MPLFKKGNQLQLGKNMGNIFAEKHSRDEALVVLTDVYVGLVTHATKDVESYQRPDAKKQEGDEDENAEEHVNSDPFDKSYIKEKYREHTGYSTIEEGFLRNGLPARKLEMWGVRFKDDPEVSGAIEMVRDMRAAVLITGTANGTIPASFGKFLLTAQLGITDQVKEDDKEFELPAGATIELIEEEGGDFSYD